VTPALRAQRVAEQLIRHACRRLPDEIRDERCREWAAELPAIVHDPDVRFALLRSARALGYAAGIRRSARQLSRAAGRRPREDTRQAHLRSGAPGGWASRSRRHPLTLPALPDGVRPAIAAVLLWLSLIAAISAYSPHGAWAMLAGAAGFAVEILAVVAIVRFIRWVRRRT
jgi:hypothetical protein